MVNYLFDVDGTITPPRSRMDERFESFFVKWIDNQRNLRNKVILVTGSDKEKTIQQIGYPLWRYVDGVYQNAGNQLYIRGKLIRESKWQMSADLHLDILDEIRNSRWYGEAEKNVEERVGMVNISTVGRGAGKVLRKVYYEWDTRKLERVGIVDRLSKKYPKLQFNVGGEISIDIYPKGMDKSQVLKRLDGKSVFFGDKCEVGGNDYTISQKADMSYHVSDWKDTFKILQTI